MYSITEVSKILGISYKKSYNRFHSKYMMDYVQDSKKGKLLTEGGLNILKDKIGNELGNEFKAEYVEPIYLFSEVARILEVTTKTVQNRIKKHDLENHVSTTKKGKVLTEKGLVILQDLYPLSIDEEDEEGETVEKEEIDPEKPPRPPLPEPKNYKMKLRMDKDHHRKVFFNHYRKLMDWDMFKNNLELYKKSFGLVAQLTDSIRVDFTTNMLLLYNYNYAKQIFLHGMSRIPTLRSHVFLNVFELLDISFGQRKDEFSSARDDSEFYTSEMNILEDILCLTCNCWEVNRITKDSKNPMGYAGEVARNCIMRRYDYVDKNPEKPSKLNWVFFKGTKNEMLTKYPGLLEYFEEMRKINPRFKIYDLNPITQISGVSGNSKKRTKNDSKMDQDFHSS